MPENTRKIVAPLLFSIAGAAFIWLTWHVSAIELGFGSRAEFAIPSATMVLVTYAVLVLMASGAMSAQNRLRFSFVVFLTAGLMVFFYTGDMW